MNERERYNLAFTTGGLMLRELVQVGALFPQLGDWDAVRARVLRDNLLQARKAGSAQRWTYEAIARLRQLDPQELALLASANRQDQASLAWIASCRRFSLIAEFMAEVVGKRRLAWRDDLGYPDFDAFLEAKSRWHPELAEISPSTRVKLRQVLFKMLREAGLLSADNRILTPTLGRELASRLLANPASTAHYFAVTEQELGRFATG